MKLLKIGILFLGLVVQSQSMIDTKTLPNILPANTLIGTDWSLDFSDDFNDTNLNTDKWTKQVSNSTTASRPDIGIADWWWKADNISLANGNLVLRVDKHDFNTMYCGSINSNNKYETKYGYFEARVKIAEAAKGTHTAFWFQGDNQSNVDNSANDGVEIDVFESAWLGDYTKAVIHIDGYGTSKQAKTVQYITPGLHAG
jgi:beta-glucanase (GH16 family)